jgi:hypothetical protein
LSVVPADLKDYDDDELMRQYRASAGYRAWQIALRMSAKPPPRTWQPTTPAEYAAEHEAFVAERTSFLSRFIGEADTDAAD